VPLVGILCLHYSVGGRIEGLTIGIVNEEVTFRECSNQSLKTFDVSIDSCDVRKISCRFMSEINDSVAVKVGSTAVGQLFRLFCCGVHWHVTLFAFVSSPNYCQWNVTHSASGFSGPP
jgi:hypothetical protein